MWLSDYNRGFRLAVGFIKLSNLGTISNYTSITIYTLNKSLQNALNFLSLCLHRLSGNGFQHRIFLSFLVPLRQSSLPGVYLTTRLGVVMQRLTIMGDPLPPKPPPEEIVCDGLRRYPTTGNCRLKTLYFSRLRRLKTPDPRLSLGWLAFPVGPRNIAAGRTKQKTHFLAADILQYYVKVTTDPQKTPLPVIDPLLCDVTAVAETRLLCHCLTKCLDFRQICHNIVELAACFITVYCLSYSSTLKMELICSSEASVSFHRDTGRYIIEDITL
jgi:hypothetical protein